MSHGALLAAMEATPTLVTLGLGHLRDEGVRKRHEAATIANTEALREVYKEID